MQQKELNALDKQMQALELRKAGVPYLRIAEVLGYASGSGAHKAVATALKKTLQEPADDLRRLELERLDAMLSAIWASVKQGQYGAIDRAIKIMERKAKLLGMDAPTRTDLTSGGKPLNWREFISGNPSADSEKPEAIRGSIPENPGQE